MHQPHHLVACVVMLVALLASACGGRTEVGGAAGGEPAASPAAVDPSPEAALPLDAVLLEGFGTDDLDRYRWDIERDAEAVLVECMAAAGFDFFLDDPLPPGPSRADLESPTFAAEQGFGVVSGFRNWIMDLDVEAQGRDRNGEYVRTLSGAEIQRYFLTLDGPTPEPGQLPDDSGCRAQAGIQSYAQWQRFLELLPNYTAIGEERDTHPDWVAASADWRACMADRGLDYTEPDAIRSDVTRRMNESVAAAYPGGNLPLIPVDGEWRIDPQVEPLLDELQRFELEAAVANVECATPLQDRFDAVEREVQQGFVDRNQGAVDEFLAAP